MTTRRQFLKGSLATSVALGAGGVLAACSGDDEDTASTGAPPTTAAGASESTTTSAQELQRLSAMMPFPLFLGFIADVTAKSGGFMAQHGIDLDLQFARSTPQTLQQLAAGNVAVIRNAPLSIARAVATEGAPFVSIGMANQHILYVLIGADGAPVTDLAALAGTTVGLPTLGSNAEDTLNLVLRDAGIDPASVAREAVGNEASALALVEEGRIGSIFGTREAAAQMQAAGLDPAVSEIPGANPLLGTNIVTTRDRLESDRELLVGYLRGVHDAMVAIDDPDQLAELIPVVRSEWDLPQLDDPEAITPVIETVASMWFAAGEENLLRNVPERWDEGVAGFARLGIIPEGSAATDFYTNDLWDEAFG